MRTAKNILVAASLGTVVLFLCLLPMEWLDGRAYAQNSNIQANNNSNKVRANKKKKLARKTDTSATLKRPDLKIIEVEQIDEHNLRVRVENRGSEYSSGCEMVMFYHRGGEILERGTPVTIIAPGGSLWFTIDAFGSLLANASKITLLVDYHDTVRESNEANNEFVFKE